MNIRICIVTTTPELLYHTANLAIKNATGEVHLMVAANYGCEIDAARVSPCASVRIEASEDNDGVVPPMHVLWQQARLLGGEPREEILVYIHDDCEILEKGWDDRVRNIMGSQPLCDCIGIIGGTGIGADDIYQVPYETIQLARHNVQSNMVDAEVHGHRTTGPMLIATADGCALMVRRSFLDEVGGWSWWSEENHGYDNALACMLRRRGRQLWLLPLVSRHPSLLKSNIPEPSRSRTQRANLRAAERFGDVYTRAHRHLYDEFRDVLPFRVGSS